MDRAENVRINLAPGQSRVVNVNVTFSGEVPPGSYFLLGYVDSDNVIVEHHEDNNIAFTAAASELVHRFGNVGGKRNVALTMPDGFGTPMTFTLRGSGYGEVERDAKSGHLSVTFYNTDDRSAATFRTPRGTDGVIEDIFVGRESVQSMSAETTDLTDSVVIIAPTSLRSLSARTTDLIGDVIADGWIGKIHMDDVADVDGVAADHLIVIGVGVAPITLIFDSLGNTSVLSVPPIGSLTATEWVDNNETPDQVVAPWVGKLQIKGRRANPRRGIEGSPGHFGADLVLSGKGAVRNTLNLTRIAGDLYGAHWDITGNMGGLTVGGIVEESTVRTTGSMGALSLGAAVGSDFLAGISSDALRHADDAQDFANVDARIRSVSILGLKLPGVEEDPYFFENSNFSAAGIGRISLLNLWPDNEGEGFGFLALARSDGGGGINSLQYRDTVTGDRWRWSPSDGPLNIMDFTARLHAPVTLPFDTDVT